jgi:hypothetical protein
MPLPVAAAAGKHLGQAAQAADIHLLLLLLRRAAGGLAALH